MNKSPSQPQLKAVVSSKAILGKLNEVQVGSPIASEGITPSAQRGSAKSGCRIKISKKNIESLFEGGRVPVSKNLDSLSISEFKLLP